MKKKILLYGVGSFKNKGCEALVKSTIDQIDDKTEIVIASFDYENDKNTYNDRVKYFVNHHNRDENNLTLEEKEELTAIKNSPFDYYKYECFYERDVIKEMTDADLCIHIGGDNYCYGENKWIYAINKKAKELGKKIVLWCASLYDEVTDLEMIDDLQKYDLIMVREKLSYDAIKNYISKDKLMLVPDSAFSLKPKKIKLNNWYKSKKVLGLNLSPLTIKNDMQKQAVIDLINYILDKTNYSISLIPHVVLDNSNDLEILKNIKELYKEEDRVYLEEKEYNCQELKYLISKCDIFIAARTHASIAAYSTSTPTLVIGYSVKSRGIAECIFGNYKNYVIPTEELTSYNLIKKFNYLNRNKNKIRENLKSKIKKYILESKNIYKTMVKQLNYLENIKICDPEKCTGCSLCKQVCPVNAIKMIKNTEGFIYPKIDLNKCTHCNLCRRNCIVLNNFHEEVKTECLGLKAKEKSQSENSSSAGVFQALATIILKEGGVIYGASLVNFNVKHIRITEKKDLKKITGSKYAQSSIDNIYQTIKEDLDNNRKVLFAGTPCQVAAIKKCFDKKSTSLYLVSVICHGVMNNDIVKKRKRELEKQYSSKLTQINFRSKKNGWSNSSVEYNLQRINKVYKFNEDPLMKLYLDNLILRKSCYECSFKGISNNPADIILGDFWGIYNINKDFFTNNGVSAVIIRTSKGKDLINKVKKHFDILQTTLSDISKYNESLIKSAEVPLERNTIFNEINNNELDILSKGFDNNKKVTNDQIINLSNELNTINNELTYTKNELNNIKNSKRFKTIDRICNIKNKIIKFRS